MGASKTVTCTFPDSYPQEDAAGREARFEITLLELKSRELPALDDAFAQQASDQQTLADLRADLETRLREDAERSIAPTVEKRLLEVLVEQLEVDLPETLIQEEVRRLIEQTAAQVAQQGVDVKKIFTQDLIRSLVDSSRPEAERQLRRRLALEALAEAEEIEVERRRIEAKFQEVWAGLQDTSKVDPDRLRLAVIEDLQTGGSAGLAGAEQRGDGKTRRGGASLPLRLPTPADDPAASSSNAAHRLSSPPRVSLPA